MKKQIIALISLITISGCDVERLTSYRYENASGKDSTSISGYIHRWDTGEPVPGARVVVNLRKAISNSDGYYLLPIQYNDDINRNQAVPYIVTAKNFAVYSEGLQIFPEPMTKSIDLVWAVPIINEPTVDGSSGDLFASAIITDYQGVETIILVKAYFYNGLDKYETTLFLDEKYNSVTGYFRSETFVFSPDAELGWQIEATDVDGHTDFLFILKDGRIIRRDPE